MRINKYLANQAYAATGADRMIQEGRVFKWAANRFGGHVGEEDVVLVDDVPVAPVAERVYATTSRAVWKRTPQIRGPVCPRRSGSTVTCLPSVA